MLDNPVWSSLTTRHAHLGLVHDGVRRYHPDVAPFLAVDRRRHVSAETLDELVDSTTYVIGVAFDAPDGWRLESLGVIAQMVCERRFDVVDGAPISVLDDPAPVRALAALVYPHYFRPRTTELGRYHGIGGPDRLDAMIGERMGWPGATEISAVCTHPDCAGRGLARRLLAHATDQIFDRGETPLLHVSPTNTRAVQLYEKNHYRHRVDLGFWVLRRG